MTDRFDYLNIVDVMQAVRVRAYTFPLCIRAQILLLVPVMCFVNDVTSGSGQGFFFTSQCGWSALY